MVTWVVRWHEISWTFQKFSWPRLPQTNQNISLPPASSLLWPRHNGQRQNSSDKWPHSNKSIFGQGFIKRTSPNRHRLLRVLCSHDKQKNSSIEIFRKSERDFCYNGCGCPDPHSHQQQLHNKQNFVSQDFCTSSIGPHGYFYQELLKVRLSFAHLREGSRYITSFDREHRKLNIRI